MVKLNLGCAIVGQAGSAFGVKVDDGERVWTLKEVIGEKVPGMTMEEASSLELFLAKKGDSWLLENDLASHILDDHPDVQNMICEYKMMPMWTIQEVLNEFKMTGEHAPSSKQIHVLVQLPDQVRVSALLQRMSQATVKMSSGVVRLGRLEEVKA